MIRQPEHQSQTLAPCNLFKTSKLYERRRRESNPRIEVLQTSALPLGYPAVHCGAIVAAPPSFSRPGRCSPRGPAKTNVRDVLTLPGRPQEDSSLGGFLLGLEPPLRCFCNPTRTFGMAAVRLYLLRCSRLAPSPTASARPCRCDHPPLLRILGGCVAGRRGRLVPDRLRATS